MKISFQEVKKEPGQTCKKLQGLLASDKVSVHVSVFRERLGKMVFIDKYKDSSHISQENTLL